MPPVQEEPGTKGLEQGAAVHSQETRSPSWEGASDAREPTCGDSAAAVHTAREGSIPGPLQGSVLWGGQALLPSSPDFGNCCGTGSTDRIPGFFARLHVALAPPPCPHTKAGQAALRP